MEVYSKAQLQEIVGTLRWVTGLLEKTRKSEAEKIRPVLEHLQKHLEDTQKYPADYYIIGHEIGLNAVLEKVNVLFHEKRHNEIEFGVMGKEII